MSTDAIGDLASVGPPPIDAGPLGPLPAFWSRHVRRESVLRRSAAGVHLREALGWLTEPLGESLQVEGPIEILWRASGLKRTGAVAQLSWPGRAARLALGFETTLAHALVDRLLGFERFVGEERLQVTPVEWGVLGFIVARTLAELVGEEETSPYRGLVLDRVGPDPFATEGLGAIVTLRWTLRVGRSAPGSLRLWLPENLIFDPKLTRRVPEPALNPDDLRHRFAALSGTWRAEAATITLPRGLDSLRVGGVLPIDGNTLRGTPRSPLGPIRLTLRDVEGSSWFPVEAVENHGGGRVRLTAPLSRESLSPEPNAVSTSSENPTPQPGAVDPTDVPVTLTVELGRINLPLPRLADLKPGDVLDLARHAREPVELTSGGKLVARGELVQIDTELGVRITNIFL